jgi:hypothetical protein
VNKAKPLDPRLINELLPEVDAFFPRDLSARKIPSLLVQRLQSSPDSPFKGLIRRLSEDEAGAVVIDSALIKAIRLSIGSALGALGPLKAHGDTPADVDGMYRILVAYWSAAKAAFPEAWGLPATDSRLMHSAGIEAMSILMDRIMARAAPGADLQAHAYDALNRISPHCRWTSGRWTELQRDWNEIQNLPRDIKLLSSHLARLDRQYAFAKVA